MTHHVLAQELSDMRLSIRVDHDDNPDDVIDKVNEALDHVGYKFERAAEETEGWIDYTLMVLNVEGHLGPAGQERP